MKQKFFILFSLLLGIYFSGLGTDTPPKSNSNQTKLKETGYTPGRPNSWIEDSEIWCYYSSNAIVFDIPSNFGDCIVNIMSSSNGIIRTLSSFDNVIEIPFISNYLEIYLYTNTGRELYGFLEIAN